MLRLMLIVCGLLLITNNNAIASSSSESIRVLINHKISHEKKAVGASVVIIEDGKVEYLNFGLANRQDKLITKSSTLFEIGSITKTFTSIALASMVNEGIMKLDDPVQKYLHDSVKMPTRNGKVITLKSLANHTSALPRLPTNMPFSDPLDPYADYSVEMMYKFLNSYELIREPGEKIEYSNLAFGLLGNVLASVDGKTYEQMIIDRVLKPLSMTNTFINVPDNYKFQLSDGHNMSLDLTKHWQLPTLAGAGAIKSNIKDMALYLKANLNQNPLKQIITLTHQQTVTNKQNPKIGLGWFIAEHEHGSYLWHNGGTGGFRSFIGFDKTNRKGIVILENSTHGMDNIGNAYLTDNLNKLESDIFNILSLEESKLKKLVGHYELAPEVIMNVTHKDQQLFIQLTGQANYPVYAKSDLEFVYRAVEARVKFELNDNGETISLTLYQGGMERKAKKLSPDVIAVRTKKIHITSEQLGNLVGRFEIRPNFVITTTHKDGQLVIQATGQPKIPFKTRSTTEFFNAQVQAKIIFELDDNNEAASLTLFQAGQTLKGTRIQ